MVSVNLIIYFAIFGVFELFAYSRGKEYLAGIKCEITNSRYPQWPHFFRIGRTVHLGYFDVASAVDTDGESGHYQLAISANYQPLHRRDRVIEDIRIVASNNRNTPCPFGYWTSCGWDVDYGVGTDGRRGHYWISLCVSTAVPCRSRAQRYVNSIMLRASSRSYAPSTPHGYTRIGSWDVEKSSHSNYDGSYGHLMMGVYVQKQKRVIYWVYTHLD